MRVIFVRHGDLTTYDVLRQRCKLLKDVEVRWDRRVGEERRLEQQKSPAERRRAPRRRELPFDAQLRGYTVVDLKHPLDVSLTD